MNLDAGRMRERIAIQRQQNVKNEGGGIARTWVPIIAGLSAEVVSINGREALVGMVLQGVSFFEIRIRYRDDIEASDQILWGSRELNIIAPPEDRLGTRQWLTIQASTAAPQGA